jgi:hypothetical protein
MLAVSSKKVTLILLLLLVVGGGAASMPAFLNMVTFLDEYLNHEDIAADYVFGVIWAHFLGATILIWPVSWQHKKILILLWLGRCLITLVAMLPFEYYYSRIGIVDAFGYFTRARQGWLGWDLVAGDGTQKLTALVWLHHQLLPDTYHAVKVSFSMIGLAAVYIFYRAAILFLQQEPINLLFILGFFPSLLFWSCLLGKEPIVLLGVAFYSYGVIGLYRYRRFRYLIFLILGVSIAMYIRVWMGFILCAPLATFLLTAVGKVGPRLLLTGLFVGTMLISVNIFADRFGLESSQDVLVTVSRIQQGSTYGGSTQNAEVDLSNSSSALAYLPLGIFTVLFRPLPGEVLTPFGLLAGLDGGLMLVLLLLAIWRVRLKQLGQPIVLWASVVILLWATFYAFGASYNLGTISRYRLQILPILLCLLLYLSQKRVRQVSPTAPPALALSNVSMLPGQITFQQPLPASPRK